MDLFSKYLTTISELPLLFAGVFIDKIHYSSLEGKYDIIKEVVLNLFESLIITLEKRYPNKHEEAIIFYDNLSQDKREIVEKTFRKFLINGTPDLNSSRFVEDIFFLQSKYSFPIQISDICSYVIRRRIRFYFTPTTSVYDNHAVEFFNIIQNIIEKGERNKKMGFGIKIIGNPNIDLNKDHV